MLEVIGLTKSFGGLVAVKDLHFRVERNSILGLVGPNGAGKTTVFNLIAGVYRPDRGEILFKDENIAGLKPYEICKKGIARTFQIVKPFRRMTVMENVTLGALFGKGSAITLDKASEHALKVLDQLGLAGKMSLQCGKLTLADQRRVELARALATRPELLLLDEVMAGLNATEIQEFLRIIQQIREQGVTTILIEHVMAAVMTVSEQVVVMDHGEKIASGTPAEVTADSKVIQAYLGRRRAVA